MAEQLFGGNSSGDSPRKRAGGEQAPKSDGFYRGKDASGKIEVDYATNRANNNLNPDYLSLPPPQRSGFRILPVSGLQIVYSEAGDGETRVVLSWVVNPLVNDYSPVFNVYAGWGTLVQAPTGTRQNIANVPIMSSELVGRTTAPPIEVRLRSTEQRRCTLTLETQLTNGFTGDLGDSPSVSLLVQPVVMKIIRTAVTMTITPLMAIGYRDLLVLADASGGAITVTYPNIGELLEGQRITTKRMNAGANVTVQGSAAAQTIDGAATVVLAAQYDSVMTAADFTNKLWLKV